MPYAACGTAADKQNGSSDLCRRIGNKLIRMNDLTPDDGGVLSS